MRTSGSLLGALLAVLVVAACGGKQDPGNEGDDCYRDADCKPGLVCVPAGETRKCSSDTTGLESSVEMPPAEMMPETPAAGGVPAM